MDNTPPINPKLMPLFEAAKRLRIAKLRKAESEEVLTLLDKERERTSKLQPLTEEQKARLIGEALRQVELNAQHQAQTGGRAPETPEEIENARMA